MQIAMSAISPSPIPGPNPSSPNDQLVLSLSELSAVELERSSVWPTPSGFFGSLSEGLRRRWQREVRRRQVGRAYDMALEIARIIPRGSRVLDVGCGNGFIAHHLSALLGNSVTGIDVSRTTHAPIDYWEFDGKTFPVNDKTFDAALFCYVLHHAQDLKPIFNEVRRTLRAGGWLLVYEDIPERWWDRVVCSIHNRKWTPRTGPCTFRVEREWRDTFASEGFELCSTRQLSRWRKIVHPVNRRLFVLRLIACETRDERRAQGVSPRVRIIGNQ